MSDYPAVSSVTNDYQTKWQAFELAIFNLSQPDVIKVTGFST